MRRTTIFRSELVTAALMAATATGLAAQQPARQAQVPASHTVVQGETLWAIAQQLLGDPLLWPEIYRLNTNIIEDPHWIYPGEELQLSGSAMDTTAAMAPAAGGDTAVALQQSVTVTPQGDSAQQARPNARTGPYAPMTGPTVFDMTNASARRGNDLELASARAYRAVREGEYFSSGFLTEGQEVPAGRIMGAAASGALGTVTSRSYHLYGTALIEPPVGETYAANDVLLTFEFGDNVDGYGNIVQPTGLLRVQAEANGAWLATVIRQYGQILDGQRTMKVQPFTYTSQARSVPVENGIEGRVIRTRDENVVTQMQSVLFIDKGADDGVRLGDVFQVYAVHQDDATGAAIEMDQAMILIVNTRSHTSTGIVVGLSRGDIGSQSLVRQVRRMPS